MIFIARKRLPPATNLLSQVMRQTRRRLVSPILPCRESTNSFPERGIAPLPWRPRPDVERSYDDVGELSIRRGSGGASSVPSRAREDDAHDKLVYGRYSKKLQPTAYKLDRDKEPRQLDHPATKKDVEAGKAIFSFEGLGQSRVWKLPGKEFTETFPLTGQWPVLTTPQQSGNGQICQAEDLKVAGKWKRYFGFLFEGRAAVVPAEEIDLVMFYAPWFPSGMFYSKIDWGITIPGPKPGFWKRQEDETLRLGDPLPVAVCVRNIKDGPQEIPATWSKELAQHGGPGALGRP